jgi:hypothetical protein
MSARLHGVGLITLQYSIRRPPSTTRVNLSQTMDTLTTHRTDSHSLRTVVCPRSLFGSNDLHIINPSANAHRRRRAVRRLLNVTLECAGKLIEIS